MTVNGLLVNESDDRARIQKSFKVNKHCEHSNFVRRTENESFPQL